MMLGKDDPRAGQFQARDFKKLSRPTLVVAETRKVAEWEAMKLGIWPKDKKLAIATPTSFADMAHQRFQSEDIHFVGQVTRWRQMLVAVDCVVRP